MNEIGASGGCFRFAAGGQGWMLKPTLHVIDEMGQGGSQRVDVLLQVETQHDARRFQPYLSPDRPSAVVQNGVAQFVEGFTITESKQNACCFRLVFQLHDCHAAVADAVGDWD